MIAIRKILVPTDFSDCAAVAIRYAKELAEKLGSRIHLLHIVPDMAVVLPEAIVPAPIQPPDLEEIQKNTNDGLKKVIDQFDLHDLQPTIETALGSPADEIIEAAKRNQADLIVCATHGRSGLAHFFLGSVAERVIRHAPCPVLTVREPGKHA
jgi:nucleotide-binding universal stress UspA family protein